MLTLLFASYSFSTEGVGLSGDLTHRWKMRCRHQRQGLEHVHLVDQNLREQPAGEDQRSKRGLERRTGRGRAHDGISESKQRWHAQYEMPCLRSN